MYSFLKGHSQLWGRADLDTSFSHFEKSSPQPEIKVHLVIASIFAVFCLIFNRLRKTCFWVSFCSSYDFIFIISGEKQYGSFLCDMPINYEMVSNAHDTGKNNGFPILDILGYLKNTHKNPKFGRVRQIPIWELGWEFPDWELSHSPKFGIFVGIL